MTTDSTRSSVWSRLQRHHLAVVSVWVIAVVSLVCAAAPLLAGYEFAEIDLRNIRSAPSVDHWMGTDRKVLRIRFNLRNPRSIDRRFMGSRDTQVPCGCELGP